MRRSLFLLLLLFPLGGLASDSQPALIEIQGDPTTGLAVFNDRDGGHCILCHQVSSDPAPFQGNLGPSLDDIGSRLGANQLRYRIVDSSRLNPRTIMPAYYRTQGLSQVQEGYRDQPILTAEDIEHLIAYLITLRGVQR